MLNRRQDRVKVLSDLDSVRRTMLAGIIKVPTVSLVQMQDTISTRYPFSTINFIRIVQFYLFILELPDWDTFKEYVLAHVFEEAD